ncbi:MAG: hypothetical protein PHQ20_00620 [Candidatus Moranbacteria bacterium]|nr:hypothetical protein [Candidatus Moranbacteria bacterium]
MENQNIPQKKRDKKLWIVFGVLVLIMVSVIVSRDNDSLWSSSYSTQPDVLSKNMEKQKEQDEVGKKQQDDIKSMYEMSRDATKRFMETENILGSIEAFPRDQKTYNAFKAEEEYYGKISGEMMLAKSPVPSHLKEFKDDISKSFDEISTASAINQNVCKNLAEYIRTADMEYQRKALEEASKKPLAYVVSATKRFISMAEKVGLDSEAMKKEMDGILSENK